MKKIIFSVLETVSGLGVILMWAFFVGCFSYGFLHIVDDCVQLLVMTMVILSSFLTVTYCFEFVHTVKRMIATFKAHGGRERLQ